MRLPAGLRGLIKVVFRPSSIDTHEVDDAKREFNRTKIAAELSSELLGTSFNRTLAREQRINNMIRQVLERVEAD